MRLQNNHPLTLYLSISIFCTEKRRKFVFVVQYNETSLTGEHNLQIQQPEELSSGDGGIFFKSNKASFSQDFLLYFALSGSTHHPWTRTISPFTETYFSSSILCITTEKLRFSLIDFDFAFQMKYLNFVKEISCFH